MNQLSHIKLSRVCDFHAQVPSWGAPIGQNLAIFFSVSEHPALGQAWEGYSRRFGINGDRPGGGALTRIAGGWRLRTDHSQPLSPSALRQNQPPGLPLARISV